MDGLGYGPSLLTSRGVVDAYDPAKPCAPPPPSDWRACVAPGPPPPDWRVQFRPVQPRPRSPDYSPGLEYGFDAYDPSSTRARPLSPDYAAHSPEPLDDSSDSDDLDYDPDISESTCVVEHLLFHARSPEEIAKLSSVCVTTDKISVAGQPVRGGLRDPRFGCSNGRACGTCGATSPHCNGHFGSYVLSCPLYNVAYNKVVIVWLRLICKHCGHVHADVESVKSGTPMRHFLKGVPSKCSACSGTMTRAISWKAAAQTMVETSTGECISAEEALRVFKQVPDDHPMFEKMAHPRCMITTVLFIPSIAVRPAVGGAEEGETPRGESDLTYRLCKIIRADLLMKKKLQESGDYVSRESALLGLQNAYSGYVDNRQCYRKKSKPSVSANGTDSNQQSAYKCLRELFVGKQGWFRANLGGKRVDHASRGVIGPFEGAHPTWLGIPKWVAESMTVPLKITRLNKADVGRMIQEKKVTFLTKSNGERVDLRMHPHPGPLEIGWTVDRTLKEGDVVLFNRQPTLSKRSFLAFFVKILDNSNVFRLCLANTGAFNADFDGDEMNLHVPQTLLARAEAEELLVADHSVINSADGQASVLNVQGDRLASYKMSSPESLLSRDLWYACLGTATDDMIRRATERPPKHFPCRSALLWSLALPDGYNWQKNKVKIFDGVLESGRITKRQLSALTHDIWADRGSKSALNFVHCVHLVSGAYNSIVEPTTIRFSEVSSTSRLESLCEDIIRDEYEELQKIKKSKHATKDNVRSSADMCMSRATRRMTELVFRTTTSSHTGFRDLVESGAKGSRLNFAMVLGGLGKQLSSDDTMGVFPAMENTNYGRRSFTHTKSRDIFFDGYVRSGYAKGMSVSEYCIHSKAGRRGLISSSNMVSLAGYLFRRLCAMLGSLVTWGGSVRDTVGWAVVSWKYGDDGRSPFHIEREMMTPAKIPEGASPGLANALNVLVEKLRPLVADTSTPTDVPLSIRRIIYDAKCKYSAPNEGLTSHACAGAERLAQLCRLHGPYYGEKIELWLQVHLHPFALWGLPKEGVLFVMEEVDKRLWKCRVEDGEPVGYLCASSLSQKATQVTLDSFHNIGSETNKNFSELEEVINQNKTRRRPEVQFKLLPHMNSKKWVANHCKVTLADVVRDKAKPREEDSACLESYWAFPDDEDETPFVPVMRLEVDTDNPFAVRVALEELGCKSLAYARMLNGHYLFHSSHDVAEAEFPRAVVTGVFENMRLSHNGVITCASMSLKQLESYICDIDLSSWYTNNFQETFRLFGIEAARALVVQSLNSLLEKFNITLSSRHIAVLSDKMSHTGKLLGCTRHGMKRDNPKGKYMQRAVFEQPVHNLMRAAAERGEDKMQDPSSKQAMGQTVEVGTNHPWMAMKTDVEFAKAHAIKCDEKTCDDDNLDFPEGADMWFPKQTPSTTVQLPEGLANAMETDPWNPQSAQSQFAW